MSWSNSVQIQETLVNSELLPFSVIRKKYFCLTALISNVINVYLLELNLYFNLNTLQTFSHNLAHTHTHHLDSLDDIRSWWFGWYFYAEQVLSSNMFRYMTLREISNNNSWFLNGLYLKTIRIFS